MTPKQKATLQKLGPFIALVLVSVGLAVLSPDFLPWPTC
jgi:ribose transport system permease protein